MGNERYMGDLHIFDIATQKWATKQTQLATQKAKASGSSPGQREKFPSQLPLFANTNPPVAPSTSLFARQVTSLSGQLTRA
jgi:hypothetical protein